MENTTYTSVDEDMICNHLHGERGVTQKIKKAMYDAAKEFVYIGFLLWEVKEYEYYYEGDYESVYEYAEAELGFKRSSTKNFIAIAETFGTVKKGCDTTHTMSLQKEYSDYNYSQLTEMLAMSPAQREKANPSMTVRDLRSLKQKDREEAIRNTPPPASMQKEPKIDFEALDKIIGRSKTNNAGQTSGHKEPTLEEINKENERLNNLYCTEENIIVINGEKVQITHYVLKNLCELAGMKYIEYEDYEITIKMKEE